MIYLRQSTASQSLVIGPFVDDTDGTTAETGLTIANTDIRLTKNGANIAAKNSGGGTHDELGFYTITLDATDTDTVGRLQLLVKMSGALVVYHEYQVLEGAVYDALYASGATGYLQPTTAGRTLDVTSGGCAGIDWANVEGASTAVDLSNTAINLCDTVTTNTDMRGTDNALLAASAPANFGDLSITATTGRVTVGTNNDKTGYSISGTITTLDALDTAQDSQHSTTQSAISALNNLSQADVRSAIGLASANLDTQIAALPTAVENRVEIDANSTQLAAIVEDTGTILPAAISGLNNVSVSDILTTQMSESYAADGTAPTLAQALFLIQQTIGDFAIAGTTITVKKLDGSTTAATYTLDDGTSPTSRTRAS